VAVSEKSEPQELANSALADIRAHDKAFQRKGMEKPRFMDEYELMEVRMMDEGT
jgi:hypothetical protein